LNNSKFGSHEVLIEIEHPYKTEIEALTFEETGYNVVDGIEPILPLVEERTKYELVETDEALDTMIGELVAQKDIAVDLEHHQYRSYQGFTCLIQISTRDKDYIVDAIALRPFLNKLNLVLTDPKILKVFHGSDMDIKWLQKDFGLYVVNLFDTFRAVSL